MATQDKSFTAVGDTTPALRLNGAYMLWRGPGDGDLSLQVRLTGQTWRDTGDVLSSTGAFNGVAPYNRHEYRLACTRLASGVSIEWERL